MHVNLKPFEGHAPVAHTLWEDFTPNFTASIKGLSLSLCLYLFSVRLSLSLLYLSQHLNQTFDVIRPSSVSAKVSWLPARAWPTSWLHYFPPLTAAVMINYAQISDSRSGAIAQSLIGLLIAAYWPLDCVLQKDIDALILAFYWQKHSHTHISASLVIDEQISVMRNALFSIHKHRWQLSKLLSCICVCVLNSLYITRVDRQL